MEIKNKEDFKAQLKAEIELNIKQFPFYLYGNIIINLIILVMIIAIAIFISGIFKISLETSIGSSMVSLVWYGSLFIIFMASILTFTIKDFFKNIHILRVIQAGHYDLGIEEYELDNTLEFIEQLPMTEEEVERMKKELSFGKLINVLDLFNIINCENGIYDIDLIFKYKTEETIDEKSEGKNKIVE